MVGKNVSIAGLDKAEVLAALYNNASPQGLGWRRYDSNPMTAEQAKKCLEEGDDLVKMLGKAVEERNPLYFDYLNGRALKVDLSADEFCPSEYDKINGKGSAERTIAQLFIAQLYQYALHTLFVDQPPESKG